MEAIFSWISLYGYAGLFLLLMFGIVGLPIPDETLLLFCGYLIWKGHLGAAATFLTAVGGSSLGISLSYLIGRRYGTRFIASFGRYLGATDKRMAQMENWFARIGLYLLAFGYFIPGVRHFTAVIAGMSEVRYRSFAVFAYSGAAVWVASFLLLGYAAGESWQSTSAIVHRYALILTAIAIVITALVWVARQAKKRKQLLR